MKILVVGGAGYIGSVCTEVLLDEKHDVAIFDNLSEGHRKAIDQRAEFIEGDLSDRKTVTALLGRLRPDAVMHFAANALVGESMANPSKYFRNNVCQRSEPARCHGRDRNQAPRVFIHLRDFWAAGKIADR